MNYQTNTNKLIYTTVNLNSQLYRPRYRWKESNKVDSKGTGCRDKN